MEAFARYSVFIFVSSITELNELGLIIFYDILIGPVKTYFTTF